MEFNPNDPLGFDISNGGDLDRALTRVSGRACLIEAIIRRLSTPRGGLFYDPGYGLDLRLYIGTTHNNPNAIANEVELEILKDERVLDVSVGATFIAGQLDLIIRVTDADGPFELAVGVDGVTIELLRTEGTD